MLLFLSRRLRTWVLVVLVLPVVGRLLERVGVRVGASRPRAGSAMTNAGRRLQSRGRRRRR